MSAPAGRILIVDDEVEIRELLSRLVLQERFEALAAPDGETALDLIRRESLDVVLLDIKMPGLDGMEILRRAKELDRDLPVIMITGQGLIKGAIEALRAGAHDYLVKPFEHADVIRSVHRAMNDRRLRRSVRVLSDRAREIASLRDLMGPSDEVARISADVARVARSDFAVLITGETGTGKELVARAIHRHSACAGGPFVAVNCAALPETLLESELFGHAKGAFTDAREAKSGLFVHASGGTLLLDEIGELSLSLQPKLLRALQERRVRPIGAATEVAINARVVAATNRDLAAAVEEGRFREDLFFRLDVLPVEVPTLRARGADVLLLAQHFAQNLAVRSGRPALGISRSAAEKLSDYPWPGNVRELENAIERAAALAEHDHILAEDLPERIRTHRKTDLLLACDDPATLVPLEVVERRYVARVLEATAGNKTLAARILGVDRKTLYRKLGPDSQRTD